MQISGFVKSVQTTTTLKKINISFCQIIINMDQTKETTSLLKLHWVKKLKKSIKLLLKKRRKIKVLNFNLVR